MLCHMMLYVIYLSVLTALIEDILTTQTMRKIIFLLWMCLCWLLLAMTKSRFCSIANKITHKMLVENCLYKPNLSL